MVTEWINLELAAHRDSELVELARQGNHDAFGELIRRHWSRCVKLSGSYLRNPSEAEDQAQNACLKAYEHLYQYSGEAEFATWLGRIVANECLMSLRVVRRVQFLFLDNSSAESRSMPVQLADTAPNPEHELGALQMTGAVRSEIRHMPPLLRKVMLLRDIDGLAMEDVAQQLGITVSAAKSRLVRARMELRSRMVRHFPENSLAAAHSTVN